jgi:RNA polymerase sigma-70 factor (ECF subfamily)
VTFDVAKRQDRSPHVADDREFEALYAEQFGFVWRCLRGLGVAEASLDDAAQEVFMVVHRRLCEFRGESSLRTWLYSIMRNVASNQRRSQRRRGEHAVLPAELPYTGPTPLEGIQDQQAAAFITEFLAGVSDGKRDVFVLALLEQMSVPDVAETLGIPLNTAYTRLRDVRLEFRKALARHRG